MEQIVNIEQLQPHLAGVKTAKELGGRIMTLVPSRPRGLRQKLAIQARDWLGATWSDRSVKDFLSPCLHTEKHVMAERLRTRELQRKRRSGEDKEKALAYERDYARERLRRDPDYRLRANVRATIFKGLVRAVTGKPETLADQGSEAILGCTIAEYSAYLEAQFLAGMTWDNWGATWEIDHIIPIAAHDLTDEDGLRAAFHFSNTRPLWKEENRSKGSLHNGTRHRLR